MRKSDSLRFFNHDTFLGAVADQGKFVPNVDLQGSVLGPTLFVLYINDLPSAILSESEKFLFADDTKIYGGIFEGTDCEKLQMYILYIYMLYIL